jgi:putative transposase
MLLKKALKSVIKREIASYLVSQFAMCIRQVCRTLSLSRTVFFYQPDIRRDEPGGQALTEAAERYPRYGFKTRQDNVWNHKRAYRIYCLLKLHFRHKGKQGLPVRTSWATPETLNQSGAIDFMHDALVCGRRFRTFNVVIVKHWQ